MSQTANQFQEVPENQPITEQELDLSRVIKSDLTMKEVAHLKAPSITTTAEAIRALKIGNARFFSGTRLPIDFSAVQRRAQILTQTPFAVVLGCSDSRVPTEIVYDQRPGDLFVIRVAGTVVESSTAGSIEYAVNHLKPKVVVVMGHEGCGAVKAAMLDEATRSMEAQNIQFLLNRIAPAIHNLPKIRDSKARMREAVVANIRLQVHQLKQNPVIAEAVQNEQIAVIGAYYEISSGAVDFLETESELRIDDEQFPERV